MTWFSRKFEVRNSFHSFCRPTPMKDFPIFKNKNFSDFHHFIILIYFFFRIGQQLLVGLFLILLRDVRSSENSQQSLIYVGIVLVIFYALKPIFYNHFINKCSHLGFRIQTALTSLVYRKVEFIILCFI